MCGSIIYKVVKTGWNLRSCFRRDVGVRIGLYADELRIFIERNNEAWYYNCTQKLFKGMYSIVW